MNKKITGELKQVMEFLKIRRKNLQIIKDQIPFNNLIEDKEEANKVLRGRLNEVHRTIRKIGHNGLDKMIEKESTSYRKNKEDKDSKVKKLNKNPKKELK